MNKGSRTKKPMVLVVEDAEDSRVMYIDYLVYAGFAALGAQNGVEAVAIAHEHTPDVIVMDLSLPTMDGWEATALLKRNPETQSIPIIALTGHGESPYRKRAADAGVDLFLMKPCLPSDLALHVKNVLATGPKRRMSAQRQRVSVEAPPASRRRGRRSS